MSKIKLLDLKNYYSVDSCGRYEHVSDCILWFVNDCEYAVSCGIEWNAGGRSDSIGGTFTLCSVDDVKQYGICYLYNKLNELKIGTNTQFLMSKEAFLNLFYQLQESLF